MGKNLAGRPGPLPAAQRVLGSLKWGDPYTIHLLSEQEAARVETAIHLAADLLRAARALLASPDELPPGDRQSLLGAIDRALDDAPADPD
jgi:hypothetical protein